MQNNNEKKHTIKKKHLFSSFSRQQNQKDDDSKDMPLDLDANANYCDLQEVKVLIQDDAIINNGGNLHSIPETLMEDYHSSAIACKLIKEGDDPANNTAL